MTKEIATAESLNAIAEMGRQLTKLYVGYAKIAESAPTEIQGQMMLNNLGTIRDRMKQVLERSRANSGLFANWQAKTDEVYAIHEGKRATHQKKRGA